VDGIWLHTLDGGGRSILLWSRKLDKERDNQWIEVVEEDAGEKRSDHGHYMPKEYFFKLSSYAQVSDNYTGDKCFQLIDKHGWGLYVLYSIRSGKGELQESPDYLAEFGPDYFGAIAHGPRDVPPWLRE
ncbi:unnamed protein product, partial [marine sediment metagenome]